MDNVKGIIILAAFLIIWVALRIRSRLFLKQVDEDGIEALGVISRINESVDDDTGAVNVSVYARYRTEDGEEIEGALFDAPSNIQLGDRVRVKYHPKLHVSAKLLEVVRESPPTAYPGR